MSIAVTTKQFHGVCRDCNDAVWPAEVLLVALAVTAVAPVLKPSRWSGAGFCAVPGLPLTSTTIVQWRLVGVQVAFLIPAANVGIGLLFATRQAGGLAKK